jgi:SNF family Na+-dependent transporter
MIAGNQDADNSRPVYVDIALTLWPSFLAAGVASVLFFSVVDPQLLRDAGPQIFDNLNREAGYALGFFFFWAVAALSSAVSIYMIRTSRRDGSSRTDRRS